VFHFLCIVGARMPSAACRSGLSPSLWRCILTPPPSGWKSADDDTSFHELTLEEQSTLAGCGATRQEGSGVGAGTASCLCTHLAWLESTLLPTAEL
jgi:hypothetical protein